MQNGDILRYVFVKFAFEKPAWYLDETDSVEKKDFVLVPYGYRQLEGEVGTVVRCVYPYVPYDAKKVKRIIEITERRGTPKE